jgi:hypothetical protein
MRLVYSRLQGRDGRVAVDAFTGNASSRILVPDLPPPPDNLYIIVGFKKKSVAPSQPARAEDIIKWGVSLRRHIY